MEDSREARGQPLNEDLEDHVGLRDPVVRSGLRHVVDLYEERSLVDRGELERLSTEGPAVPTRRVRSERRLDRGRRRVSGRGPARRAGSRGGRAAGGEQEQDRDEGERVRADWTLPHSFRL